MTKTDDRYDDFVPAPAIACEDVQRMAIEATVVTHLVGCAFVLAYLAVRGDFRLLAACFSLLLVTFVIPLIGASLFGFAIFRIFHRTLLPLPLFVRTCAVLIELSLLIWFVVFLIHAHPEGWHL